MNLTLELTTTKMPNPPVKGLDIPLRQVHFVGEATALPDVYIYTDDNDEEHAVNAVMLTEGAVLPSERPNMLIANALYSDEIMTPDGKKMLAHILLKEDVDRLKSLKMSIFFLGGKPYLLTNQGSDYIGGLASVIKVRTFDAQLTAYDPSSTDVLVPFDVNYDFGNEAEFANDGNMLAFAKAAYFAILYIGTRPSVQDFLDHPIVELSCDSENFNLVIDERVRKGDNLMRNFIATKCPFITLKDVTENTTIVEEHGRRTTNQFEDPSVENVTQLLSDLGNFDLKQGNVPADSKYNQDSLKSETEAGLKPDLGHSDDSRVAKTGRSGRIPNENGNADTAASILKAFGITAAATAFTTLLTRAIKGSNESESEKGAHFNRTAQREPPLADGNRSQRRHEARYRDDEDDDDFESAFNFS